MIAFIDPPPRLPAMRELILMYFLSVNLEVKSWTNAVKLIQTVKRERQISLLAQWRQEEVKEEGNQIDLSLGPNNYMLFDPLMGKE